MLSNGNGPKKGIIEQTYQEKSQLESILLRPDTYIGSVEKVTEKMWTFNMEKEMMEQREIEYVPGLYKIFDQILVNAADNKQRDKKMDCIRIEIRPEENKISIWNNGKGIPVVMHKEEKIFVPTMIFGSLLTSSNYNDEEEKVTGGRNGYGAKLCNIFSDKFIVETASKQSKKQFKQIWAENMSKASKPQIKDFHGEEFTKITFHPDLKKFKMDQLNEGIVALMSRRAYDVAASTRGVKVFLNDQKLPVKNFKDYIDLFIKDKEDERGNSLKVIYEQPNERWEVAVTMSDGSFQQVSFVNSIATTKGGRHVDHVVDLIVEQLQEVFKKKNKGGMAIKPHQIKSHMWVFVNCLIVNPTFDSQTKENMTLQAKSFGSKCDVSEKFINSVQKSGIVETVLTWAQFEQQNVLAKAIAGKRMKKLKGIPKLDDANEAGTNNGLKCTLILTEGDSAKSLAVSGLDEIGRDYYGVFPLRGLGTLTSKEAKEYFRDMSRHRIRFDYKGQEDDDHIVLAFSRKHIEARKEWLTNFMVESKRRKENGLAERYLYTKETRSISYKDFVNLELVLVPNADNIRSIPCLVDGFKPVQRKVIYTCIKRNDKRENQEVDLEPDVWVVKTRQVREIFLRKCLL